MNYGVWLRYSSWSAALAKKVEDGKASLEEVEAYALKTSEPKTSSGKQDHADIRNPSYAFSHRPVRDINIFQLQK